MAIGWPEASDGAPRRGLMAKEDFLVARGKGGTPRGRESDTAIAAWAIEVRPAFGQIRPWKRPAGARDQRSGEGDDSDLSRALQEARPVSTGLDLPIFGPFPRALIGDGRDHGRQELDGGVRIRTIEAGG